MWLDTSPRSRGGTISQFSPVHLVPFFGHSDYFRIEIGPHQSKANFRTFPKQLDKGLSPQTWKVKKWVSTVLEPSWLESLPENGKQSGTAESRDVENSLLMILFEHLDLAIPEAIFRIVSLQISLFIQSQFRAGFLSLRLKESWLTWLQKAGKKFKYVSSATACLSACAWKKKGQKLHTEFI